MKTENTFITGTTIIIVFFFSGFLVESISKFYFDRLDRIDSFKERIQVLELDMQESKSRIYELEKTRQLETLDVVSENETATVTAYTWTGNKNAAGRYPQVGDVACPRSVELGTRIKITDKEYVCTDRTAKKYDGRYDIYMNTRSEAVQWGKQRLNVDIL